MQKAKNKGVKKRISIVDIFLGVLQGPGMAPGCKSLRVMGDFSIKDILSVSCF